MKRDILQVKGVKIINKKMQSTLKGGGLGDNTEDICCGLPSPMQFFCPSVYCG